MSASSRIAWTARPCGGRAGAASASASRDSGRPVTSTCLPGMTFSAIGGKQGSFGEMASAVPVGAARWSCMFVTKAEGVVAALAGRCPGAGPIGRAVCGGCP